MQDGYQNQKFWFANLDVCCSSKMINENKLFSKKNRPPPPPPPPPPPWTPPCLDFVKINTYASWDKQSLQVGLAVIVRNSSG
ncbi:hypothetical protein RchiOBHm_Chr5g0070651 [Rosa chinensis]|uniref:Uncharacterized protein n=1 Tax=Rosa chinensis TaxID=74649 RepID=A0A2P6QK75_ROSCH|nr:hypothetical protein RchiOBHm_Chr5g0070651 [Rosa chinensis]